MPILLRGALSEGTGNEGVAFILDLSEQKRAEAEIRALRDQLYKENLALRDEVDRASMFEEIVGTSKPLRAVISRIARSLQQIRPFSSQEKLVRARSSSHVLFTNDPPRSVRAFVSLNLRRACAVADFLRAIWV